MVNSAVGVAEDEAFVLSDPNDAVRHDHHHSSPHLQRGAVLSIFPGSSCFEDELVQEAIH